jgi:hypothetical protein
MTTFTDDSGAHGPAQPAYPSQAAAADVLHRHPGLAELEDPDGATPETSPTGSFLARVLPWSRRSQDEAARAWLAENAGRDLRR